MPTGTLPDAGKKIYEAARKKALTSTCKDRKDKDECASKIGWTAVKNAGY